jgi:hypothetical protein
MTTIPIKTFADVILFELQKRNRPAIVDQRPTMLWSIIWHVCADAAPNLEAHAGRAQYRTMFTYDLFYAIEELEQKKYVKVIRRAMGRQTHIIRIELTGEGKSSLEKLIFTNQSGFHK